MTPAFVVFAGRASALFALLAGVGLALATGGSAPRLRPWRGVVAAVLARAAVVAAVGLLLGELSPPVAVILTNYGLLFVLALPALRARPPTLLVVAAGWVVVTPLLGHLLRRGLPPGPGAQPSVSLLMTDPLQLVQSLTLTGYYPVLGWTAYLLVGLAVGRLDLRRTGTAVSLLAVGAVVAVAARLVSDVLLTHGGLAALRLAGPADLVPAGAAGDAVDRVQSFGRFGTVPTTTWWWQAVATPHTTTAFDLAHTIGSAVAVLGFALLVVAAASRGPARLRVVWDAPVAALAATGSMTLSLYTVHVLVLAGVGPVADRTLLLAANVVVALVVATAWRAARPRGPLEQLVADVAGAARRRVTAAGSTPPRSRP